MMVVTVGNKTMISGSPVGSKTMMVVTVGSKTMMVVRLAVKQ